MNKNKIILDLCGGTGGWSQPYNDNGYKVFVITLPDFDITKTMFGKNGMTFIGKSELENTIFVKYSAIYGVLAAPPCTMFSRARTTAKTPRDFVGAMEVVQACLNVIWQIQYNSHFTLQFWAMENPAGHLQRFLGKPPFKFHPYDFGDSHSKQTFIWGNYKIPKTKPIQLTADEIRRSQNNTRKLPPIPANYKKDGKMKSVQIRRSITPQGFAAAFYKANQ